MANLKRIRRRITTVRNTQKITRAMKMVAAARLRKAEEAVARFRPYAEMTQAILAEVAREANGDDHPLLVRRETKRSLSLVMTSDRGLCGGFNGNLGRFVLCCAAETESKPGLIVVGRKGADFFSRRALPVDSTVVGVYDGLSYATAARIAKDLVRRYTSEEADRIDIAFNEFISMGSQRPCIRQLLPVVLPEEKGPAEQARPGVYIYEPSDIELLSRLLPKYVEVQVFRALLESVAAEQAARMTAMDNATNNADDMLKSLTLQYNRARQSAITSDLMDIVGGAEALKD